MQSFNDITTQYLSLTILAHILLDYINICINNYTERNIPYCFLVLHTITGDKF